jgi:hypothetical protein
MYSTVAPLSDVAGNEVIVGAHPVVTPVQVSNRSVSTVEGLRAMDNT